MEELTLYSDELQQLFAENGIEENVKMVTLNKQYQILKDNKQSTLTILGISYGLYEDLYTVEIRRETGAINSKEGNIN